jgi:hypothetical protein
MPEQRGLSPPCLPFHHAPKIPFPLGPVELDEERTNVEPAEAGCVIPASWSPENPEVELGHRPDSYVPAFWFTDFACSHLSAHGEI